jgi:hypothetical protein
MSDTPAVRLPTMRGVSVCEPPARLAVRNIEDLVGLVPYLIGFHPGASLVIVVIEHGRVAVTARVDLVAVSDPGALVGLLGRLFERFGAAEAWFLAYTDDAEAAWPLLDSCAELAGSMRLGRLIQVGERHWWADHAGGEVGVVTASPAAAQAAVLGLPVRASRAELAKQIQGPADDQIDGLLVDFEAAIEEFGALGGAARRRAIRRLVQAPSGRSDYVRMAVLARDPQVQSAVLERLELGTAAESVALWTAVVGHCLVPYVAGPLGLLGVAAWLTGDGAMQTVCLERLDRIDPLDPLAALLDWINNAVLPPDEWPRYRSALLAAVEDQARLLSADRD